MRGPTAPSSLVGVLTACCLLTSPAAFANTPPTPPAIIEPSATSPVDPGDVHMATAPFHDDDSDALRCSDWEIHSETGLLVWYATCAEGLLAVHIHLGDGTFVNPEGHLLGLTHYVVRVRFRDSSGDADTEWSDWSERDFNTGPGSAVHPMEIVDVLPSPPPRLQGATLPADASVALTSERGDVLLSFSGSAIANPPPLNGHALVKAVIATSTPLPPLTIAFNDETGASHTVYLPAVAASAEFWIAQDGSSFAATPGSTSPQFVTLARGADTPWKVVDGGYAVERVVSGLQLPVNIAFVPRPLPDADAPIFYVTELYGTIRAVLRDGTMRDYATDLLDFNPTGVFPGTGEHGSVGTAVDPDSGDLFVAVVHATASGEHDPRVVRIHSNDGGRTAASVTTLLDMPGEEIGPSHQISNVSIGAEGKLYVHVGDGFHTEVATDLHFFRGKILRMNLDGSAPHDNPFYDGADGITATDYIFAYGFRNPFGGAWRAADASLYEVDNGPRVDRLAKVSAGLNFQWNGSDDDMRAHAAYNWEESVAPVNIAFVQDATFAGSGFPAARRDHAFVSESGPTWVAGTTELGKRIREFAFDAGGNVTSTRPFLEYTGTGYSTVAALAAGPDGLYFSDLFPEHDGPTAHAASVYRIRRIGNVAIAASAGNAPQTIDFVGRVDVPQYGKLTWDFGDGTTSNEPNLEHAFPSSGPFDVRLSVVDAQGTTIDDYKRVQFPAVAGSGLTAVYTNKDGETLERLDPQIDLAWPVDAPMQSDSLSVTWSGEIAAPIDGDATFVLESGGSGVLRIDGQTVIDTRANGAASTNPVHLEAGRRYTFLLEYNDVPMAGVTQLSWSTDSLPPRVVPSAAFYPAGVRRRAAGH
jgi:glucose/arabinose dehydrogenase